MVCSNCDHLKIYIGDRLVADVDPDRKNFPQSGVSAFCDEHPRGSERSWGDLKIEGYIGGKLVVTKMMSGKGVRSDNCWSSRTIAN